MENSDFKISNSTKHRREECSVKAWVILQCCRARLHWEELQWVGSSVWLLAATLKCCCYAKAITAHLSTDLSDEYQPGGGTWHCSLSTWFWLRTWVACFSYLRTLLFCPGIAHFILWPCCWCNHSLSVAPVTDFALVSICFKSVLNSGLVHCTEPQEFSNKQELSWLDNLS